MKSIAKIFATVILIIHAHIVAGQNLNMEAEYAPSNLVGLKVGVPNLKYSEDKLRF